MSGTKEIGILKKEQKKTGETGGIAKLSGDAWRSLAADFGCEVLGSLILAVTTYNVALYAEFPMTGFSGIAMILYRLFRVPMGLSTILLNIPVAILCGRLIGKQFLVKSFRCMVISSLMLDYLAPLLPVYQGDRMIAALITGAVGALGYAMIYVRGSSTGGSDFIVMAVKAVRPYWNLGTIAFLSDVGVILAGGMIFKDLDGIVYGMIINLLFAVVVDKVILGMNAGMVALIVTEYGKMVTEEVDRCCMRGSTILKAAGGYQYDKKDVVMVAGSNKDIYQVQKRIREVEPKAFMIIMDSHEVHGEGFRITRVAGG
ncbi:YitT family protein [bacterium D16-54]|nr:YitT family protein [bacterium D16-54]RKJ10269.1 YitT family protein [bacterium D16-56]